MLVNAYAVIELTKVYRVVWIQGRYGGGKTALSYRLAYELLNSGFSRYLISNCRSVWRDEFSDVTIRDGAYLDTCIILDEGGLFLRTGKDTENLLAFMRKFNIILIIPSVRPPSRSVCQFSIQRVANLRKVGLPAWVYRSNLRYENIRESYWFLWWQPSEIFGLYDTRDVPIDDAGVSDWLIDHTRSVVSAAGQGKHDKRGRYGFQSLESGGGEVTSDALAEAAEAISGLVPLLERGGGRKRGR